MFFIIRLYSVSHWCLTLYHYWSCVLVFPSPHFVEWTSDLHTVPSQQYIHWKQSRPLTLCVLQGGGGASAAWINVQVRKDTTAAEMWRRRGLYTAGSGYFWSFCRTTNYTQVTAILGVTLSNFYPRVCVHTSWLSHQYVCVFVWQ